MSKNYSSSNEKSQALVYFNSVVLSLVTSLILILIFALLIKWFEWGDGVISPVNITIKIISIATGVFVATKHGANGIKKGAFVGFFYTILSFIIFSILLGKFVFTIKIVYDLIFGVISGAILGIIFVNVKK